MKLKEKLMDPFSALKGQIIFSYLSFLANLTNHIIIAELKLCFEI